MNREDIATLASEIHGILSGPAESRGVRTYEAMQAHGCAGDYKSIESLLVAPVKPVNPTVEEVEATLCYVFCLPLSVKERAQVVGANQLFWGTDVDGRRNVGGTTKPRKRGKR
jgi:hypothetical protein